MPLFALPSPEVGKVLEVRTVRAFAGRLGERVHQELTVQLDGRTVTVRSHVQHTRMGRLTLIEAGETVRLLGSAAVRTR